jgi:16S rRNA G966 N2-methylase RsmD
VCGFTSGYVTFLGHVDKGVRMLEKKEELFDVIFVDPPYEKGLVKEALSLIASAGLLKSGGTVAVEHSIREDVGGNGVLTMTDQRRYGDTVLSFFENDDTREVTHGENSSISRII